MKLSEFYRDSAKVKEGQWIGDIPGFEGVEFLVRGDSHAGARALRDKLMEDWAAKNGDARVPAADEAAMNAQIIREEILLDWRGIEDDENNPVPVNTDLIGNPDFEDLTAAVMFAARRVGRNIVKAREADAKN